MNRANIDATRPFRAEGIRIGYLIESYHPVGDEPRWQRWRKQSQLQMKKWQCGIADDHLATLGNYSGEKVAADNSDEHGGRSPW